MTPHINPMPEIESLARQLRLTGMLEMLYQRNKEAIESNLSHPEFLGLLLQDEKLKREQRKFETRVKKAGFRPDKSIERFDFLFNPKINKQQILDVVSCRFVKEKVCVLIVGPCGTGKSHLAHAIAQCATQQGIDTQFTTQTKLLKTLKSARATDVYEKTLQALIKLPLLIIDDFGLKPLRTPEDEDFHDLISERYEKGATVITSNLDFKEWIQAFPNRLLGVATIDRLRDGSYAIILDGESHRTFRDAPTEPLKSEKGV